MLNENCISCLFKISEKAILLFTKNETNPSELIDKYSKDHFDNIRLPYLSIAIFIFKAHETRVMESFFDH